MKTVTYTVIDHSEFETLVKEHLGVSDFSIIAENEMNNDSSFDYDPRYRAWGENDKYKSGWEADLAAHAADEILAPNTTMLYIAQLIEKGVIPAEHQIKIEVWW